MLFFSYEAVSETSSANILYNVSGRVTGATGRRGLKHDGALSYVLYYLS